MLIITSREFRANQKRYFDLAEKEQVIIQRSKSKAFAIVPITEDDKYFADPEVMASIKRGIAQVAAGETIKVKKEDLKKYLGLE